SVWWSFPLAPTILLTSSRDPHDDMCVPARYLRSITEGELLVQVTSSSSSSRHTEGEKNADLQLLKT
ncbi:Hypothetical predicted protein, partial [Pelobates cultripes]